MKSTKKSGSRPKKATRKVPVPIQAVDFVMYSAKKPLELRGWYAKTFGLKRGHEWNRFWSEFNTEPVTFCLNGPNTKGDPNWSWTGTPAIAFAVEDIHAAALALRKQRTKILIGPVETRVCWMLFIEDPEGNRVVIHQRKDGTSG